LALPSEVTVLVSCAILLALLVGCTLELSLPPIIHHMLQSDPTITEKEAKSRLSQMVPGYKCVVKSNVFSSVRGAILDEVNRMLGEAYSTLTHYLEVLSGLNPTMTITLQLDADRRFHQMFLALPTSQYHGVITQPLHVMDCFHIRHPSCDVFIVAFVSKSGCGKTVVDAIAWCAGNENATHLAWVTQMCLRAGITTLSLTRV
jgi:hypothetical protein